MKTYRLFIIQFLLILNISYLQGQNILSLGPKLGISLNKQQWNFSSDTMSRDTRYSWGISVGGFVQLHTSQSTSIILEGTYIQKGTTMKYSDDYYTDIRINYFSVPLLFKYAISDSGTVPYITCGPRVDYLVSTSSDDSLDKVILSKIQKRSIGVTLGVGITTDDGASFEFRYNHTLYAICDDKMLSIKNYNFEIMFSCPIKY